MGPIDHIKSSLSHFNLFVSETSRNSLAQLTPSVKNGFSLSESVSKKPAILYSLEKLSISLISFIKPVLGLASIINLTGSAIY